MCTARSRQTRHTDLNLCAFHNDPNNDYSVHQSVLIGGKVKICMFCGAFKFKNEVPGLLLSWTVLYVATSRVGKPSDLFVYAPDGKTKNFVYPQVLQ